MTHISVTELDALRKKKTPLLLIDVREQDEWDMCNIDGAILIPIMLVRPRIEEIRDLAEGKSVVVYCQHGSRSLYATKWLNDAGISAKSLEGGINEWALKIDKTMPKY